MGKLAALVLVTGLTLTGCASVSAAPIERPTVQPAAVSNIYTQMTPAEIGAVRSELCEHFAEGFTVEDAVSVQASLFGSAAGENLRAVAQQVQESGC